MTTVVRAVGALCCMLTILGAIGFVSVIARTLTAHDEQAFKFSGKARGLESMPALAMEFVDDEREVEAYLGARDATGDSETRRSMRAALAADNVFIAFYWLLFMGLCALMAMHNFKLYLRGHWLRLGLWLAVFATVCATGAAISDTVENAHTAALLDAPAVTKALVRNVASASAEKWVLIALATLALSPLFIWAGYYEANEPRPRPISRILFPLYLAVGALILAGVIASFPALVAVGFVLNFVGVAIVAFVFTRRPRWSAWPD